MKRFLAIVLLFSALICCTGCAGGGTHSLSGSSGTISGDVTSQAGNTEHSSGTSIELYLPQLGEPEKGDTLATLKTSMGDITLRFFPDEAPLAVENFLSLARNGYYDGVSFHNVVADYMIQSGDPTGTGTGGESSFLGENGEPEQFADEFSPSLFHFSGALAMANSGFPDSNGSQFFIVANCRVSDEELARLSSLGYPNELVDAYRVYGGIPRFDYRYTVFGCVVDGMSVVQRISRAYTSGASGGRPVEDVIIEAIELSER